MKKRRRQKNKRSNGTINSFLLSLITVILGLVILIFIYSATKRNLVSKSDTELTDELRVVRVQVLNGCRESGAAQCVTDFLRAHKIDVVKIGNTQDEFRNTVVVDMVGENESVTISDYTTTSLSASIQKIGISSSAKRVAKVLGINPMYLIQSIDENPFFEVTVIVGKDYKELDSLHEFLTESNEY